MLQPIDNASVIEGTAAAQLGSVQSLPNSASDSAFSLYQMGSYLVSNPWIGEPTTPNKDERAAVPDQREVPIFPVVVPLFADVSARNVKVRPLQHWIGRVERCVAHDRFVAIISDVTTPTNPAAEVELHIEDVSLPDRGLVAEGAIFYWSIAYRDSKGGQRERVTTIRFARHPKLGAEIVDDIFTEADKVAELLESA